MGVVKLADYRPQLEVVEHRVADTEDGFMRVANEITDSLLMADLTVRQLKVMLAIMRKTYGFNKPMDRLTNTQIAAMTGIHHTHVCAAKRQLIERKFLIVDGVKIGVNKVVSQWISQDSLTLAKTANKTLAKSANGYKPSQLNTKDNIQKTINTNTPLPPNGGGDGQVKPERRKAERIDYESFLNAYNTEVGDRLPHAVAVNEKRKRRLKKIIPQLKTPNVDGFRAYVRAFVHQAKPFYFGDNDTGWTADFDYLLREDSLTGVTAAETELADHETRIAANESELADHDARITQNTTDIDALDTRLTAAEGSISTLQSTVGDHSTRISALEYATTRKKSEVVYSGVSVTIPTAPTNLVSLLKTLTPSSGTLAPFFDTVNNKMVVFNENKTLFFKLSIVGTWPSGTANRSMQLTFSGSVPDTLVSSRNAATTTDNILLATFFSVDKDGFLATNGSTLTIQSNGAAFNATTIKIIAEQ
ncbi:TPA: hypothetical protein HNO02_22190 [Escherichia coli]|nr:hypothetical protein [Escherichia coli]